MRKEAMREAGTADAAGDAGDRANVCEGERRGSERVMERGGAKQKICKSLCMGEFGRLVDEERSRKGLLLVGKWKKGVCGSGGDVELKKMGSKK